VKCTYTSRDKKITLNWTVKLMPLSFRKKLLIDPLGLSWLNIAKYNIFQTGVMQLVISWQNCCLFIGLWKGWIKCQINFASYIANISTHPQLLKNHKNLKYTIPKYTYYNIKAEAYFWRAVCRVCVCVCVLRVRLQRFVYNCDTPITQLRMHYYHIMHFI
jgi:hypothetical protein